jgi:hypothetical protein
LTPADAPEVGAAAALLPDEESEAESDAELDFESALAEPMDVSPDEPLPDASFPA